MHVLLLTTAYKNKFTPVNSLFFYDQAKALSNYGFKVGVICSMPITFSNILRSKKFPSKLFCENALLMKIK